ncbi:MAG: hypothetical protein ACRDLL_10975 [Solirubrobacterales bacterium]
MDIISTVAVVASVLFFAMQARSLAGQSRVANEVAGTQAHRDLLLRWKSWSDVFIRYPELHAHYYDQSTDTPSASDNVRLGVIADQQADWLNAGVMTSERLASYAHWGDEWTVFVPLTLASSSRLRAIIRDNPGVYPPVEPFVAAYDASHEQGTAA